MHFFTSVLYILDHKNHENHVFSFYGSDLDHEPYCLHFMVQNVVRPWKNVVLVGPRPPPGPQPPASQGVLGEDKISQAGDSEVRYF